MPNPLRERWAEGQPTLNLFLTIPNAWTAELMAQSGFDALTLDMQHGLIDFNTALSMLQAINTTDTVPLVRLPWNEPSIIMKMLDAGAAGLICPMIDTAREATAFVRSCHYPPDGIRSFGPIRAARLTEEDYFETANREVLAFVMIETASAAEHLEAIAATPGLDGLFVGPFDLSVSLGLEKIADIHDPELNAILQRVLKTCEKNELISGIYTQSLEHAATLAHMGFRLISTGDDTSMLAQAAKSKQERMWKRIEKEE